MIDPPETAPGPRARRSVDDATTPAAPPPLDRPRTGAENRGRRAEITQAGEAVGSGAAAGGKGGAEDFGTDPMAGSGGDDMRHASTPSKGGDGRKHGGA